MRWPCIGLGQRSCSRYARGTPRGALPDRRTFACDNRRTYYLHGSGIGKVAIGMEVTESAVYMDSVKDRGHRPGHELTHGKDRPTHPQRRQDIEQVGVAELVDFQGSGTEAGGVLSTYPSLQSFITRPARPLSCPGGSSAGTSREKPPLMRPARMRQGPSTSCFHPPLCFRTSFQSSAVGRRRSQSRSSSSVRARKRSAKVSPCELASVAAMSCAEG